MESLDQSLHPLAAGHRDGRYRQVCKAGGLSCVYIQCYNTLTRERLTPFEKRGKKGSLQILSLDFFGQNT